MLGGGVYLCLKDQSKDVFWKGTFKCLNTQLAPQKKFTFAEYNIHEKSRSCYIFMYFASCSLIPTQKNNSSQALVCHFSDRQNEEKLALM